MTGRSMWCVMMMAGAALGMVARSAMADPVEEPNDVFWIDVDARIDSREPNHNFGVSTTARVIVNGSDGSLVRSLVKLPDELWSIPGEEIVSAKVYFHLWADNTGGRTVTLHPLTRAFVEGTGDGTPSGDGATWETYDGNNAWADPNGGGDYDTHVFATPVESTNWFSWDITPLWDNTNLRSFGAILRMNDESDPGAPNQPRAPFTSSDGSLNERPYVRVIYSPPPAFYRLVLTVRHDEWGDVDIQPEPNDANDPQFPEGTPVVLTANPIPGKGFRHWFIYDPNRPGDANYAVSDANLTTSIVMASDMYVKAAFKCGSGVGPLLPMMLGILGVSARRHVRRAAHASRPGRPGNGTGRSL